MFGHYKSDSLRMRRFCFDDLTTGKKMEKVNTYLQTSDQYLNNYITSC